MANFVNDLRAIPTKGATFRGRGRGGVLRAHDEWMHICLARSEGLLDVGRARAAWDLMRDLPRGCDADVMSHGDLIAGNVLVSAGGGLAGVIDIGGLGPADPALDLVAAWHLLGAGPRRVFRESLNPDDLEWQRGKGWAFQQAMGLIWYYAASNPILSLMGQRTLDRLLTDPW